jgi:hypothetical protein
MIDDDGRESSMRMSMTLFPLADDVRQLGDQARAPSSSQLIRRSYARAVFASIEAHLELFVDLASTAAEHEASKYELKLMYLRNKEPVLTDKGRVEERTRLHSFSARARLLFNVLEKTSSLKVPVDFGGIGWKSVMESLELRHELTHPKLGRPMDVTRDEIAALGRAHEWISTMLRNLKGPPAA